MPFINTKVSVPLSKEKEEKLTKELGKAITILGKSEAWLMLGFEDNCRLAFKGKSDGPFALLDVSLLGSATRNQYDDLTATLCKLISDELNIPQDNIYIKYEEASTWGYNGFNF
jgi:phenylpyruvate tautomerase PptA (4-oxalocrotonate tautomerase family)